MAVTLLLSSLDQDTAAFVLGLALSIYAIYRCRNYEWQIEKEETLRSFLH